MNTESMFRMGQVCFDMEAKELVKISNGTDAGGVFKPTEAIAIRVIGFSSVSGAPNVAWTYRGVKASSLALAKWGAEDFEKCLAATTGRI